MDAILKSWKSTTAGVAILAVVAAFLLGRIDLHQFLAAFATLAGAGLVAAKDAQ